MDASRDAAWQRACLPRERREYVYTLILGVTVYPAYYLFDLLLEAPHALQFGILRVIGTIVFAIALLGVRRAPTLTAARWWFVCGIGGTAPLVGAMLPQVEHFSSYLVNYSAFVWACVLLSWPTRCSIGLLSWLIGSVAILFLVIPSRVAAPELVSAGFFLPAAAVLTTLAIYSRRSALEREFIAHEKLVAQEKQAALGRMLAGLSHEINNPMNVIHNNLEPVREHLDEILAAARIARAGDRDATAAAWDAHEVDWRAADAEDALRAMHDAVAHIRQVHADLRAFIRGDAPDPIVTDLNQGLRATAALIARHLPAAIAMRLELDAQPALSCHPGQLNQLWLNLIQNAVDAVGGAGTITVRAHVDRDHHIVSVTDTGGGVPAAFRARLFEPFATTKGPREGTGLGLATSFEIAARHGGRLYLDDSYAPGARFVVELPCAV
jgi:signal transduction histidine kinase